MNEPHLAKPVAAGDLAALAFFDGISPEHLAKLARYSKHSHFDPGATILIQGEPANRFYVLQSGRVRLECESGGRRFTIQEIGPGEPVGFSWYFTPEKMHFTATAIDPVDAVFFYGTVLREDCELDAELGYELMKRTGAALVNRLEALITLAGAAPQ